MKTLAPSASRITTGKLSRFIDYGDPSITFDTVLADLEKVRQDPAGAAARAATTFAALAADTPDAFSVDGTTSLPAETFVLLPDMPAPELDDQLRRRGPVGATPPAVTVPPPEPLITGAAWFDAVDANPFHQGLLSGLRAYA
jgi:hypothetical protein